MKKYQISQLNYYFTNQQEKNININEHIKRNIIKKENFKKKNMNLKPIEIANKIIEL